MAEFRNETVLCLRPPCESLLSSTVLEVQYESSKSSAVTAGFFLFFSSHIYFRKLKKDYFRKYLPMTGRPLSGRSRFTMTATKSRMTRLLTVRASQRGRLPRQ